jgi:hypothetical protein
VLEQRKTILKVLLSCVSSQKNKFTVLEKRKYRNGIFTEMVPTRTLATLHASSYEKKTNLLFYFQKVKKVCSAHPATKNIFTP